MVDIALHTADLGAAAGRGVLDGYWLLVEWMVSFKVHTAACFN